MPVHRSDAVIGAHADDADGRPLAVHAAHHVPAQAVREQESLYAQAGIPCYLRVELDPLHVVAYRLDADDLRLRAQALDVGRHAGDQAAPDVELVDQDAALEHALDYAGSVDARRVGDDVDPGHAGAGADAGQLRLARQHYLDASELYKSEQNQLGLANAYQGLGDVERRQRELGIVPLPRRVDDDLRDDAVRVLKADNNAWIEVQLHEGKHHEVRRLMDAVGHPVAKLKRLAIGPVTVRGLKPGEYRALTPAEIEGLRRAEPPPDIAALLAHLEIAQADVMGYSLGGGVAPHRSVRPGG